MLDVQQKPGNPARAVLLIDCPDRKGLVARVAGLLYEQGANILHADQHQDHELGLFFMRVEWALDSAFDSTASFLQAFTPLAEELQMRWQLHRTSERPRVALFCSQYLHCIADLLHRSSSGELDCEIAVIVSNHRDAEKLAAFHGIRFEYIPVTPATRTEAEAKQLALLQSLKIDLVVLARYMQILSPDFLARIRTPIINIHHSFLPAFAGADPYSQARERGVKLIGATAHYVNEELDAGPIIEQDAARITHRASAEGLAQIGRDIERTVLARAVQWHLEDRVLVDGKGTVVFT